MCVLILLEKHKLVFKEIKLHVDARSYSDNKQK